MYNFNRRLVFQILLASTVLLAKHNSWAGQYDNQVLDQVSAKEFIMILDQPVPKLFKRTQLPNAINNLCTVNNGQASSVAIASKLRVVGGSGAVSTLQAATGSNSTGNTTANTTVQNNTAALASNNKPNTNTNNSNNNRANSGEVLNTQNSGNQTSSANNSSYVPSLPTPRTNSASTNATTATNNNSSAVATNNTGSNSLNTTATRTNNNVTSNANANATASNVRVNNQANSMQTTQNWPTRPASSPSVSHNNTSTNANANANVPYIGNAIATVNLAVNFGNDSDQLSAKDKILLKELAQALNSTVLRKAEFAVVGHTSSTGPYLRNLELSCARAIAVRNHLIDLGVKAARLTPYGYGPDKPLANIAAQEVGNRRVEISRAK